MKVELLPVSRTKVDWPLLRKTVAQATGFSPSTRIAQSPVNFSEVAEYLTFTAYLYLDITEDDPHKVLTNLPRECMDFMHYTFLFACTHEVTEDLREKTRAHYTMTDLGKGYCVLGTGPLSVWHDAVVLNLTHPLMSLKAMKGTRTLLNKLLLFFESEGLYALFSRYGKKQLGDKTFLLER
jgi:hypothetical protein